MPKPPKISSALAEKHKGETAISLLSGKVVAFGKNAVEALNKAKEVMPDIEDTWQNPRSLNFLTLKVGL